MNTLLESEYQINKWCKTTRGAYLFQSVNILFHCYYININFTLAAMKFNGPFFLRRFPFHTCGVLFCFSFCLFVCLLSYIRMRSMLTDLQKSV